ncbi:LacI family transcriptional regulator [Spinactinospora alkalitolerans]|uniref:LacI family transcriptional regulator n=1 Tax=Spinactinospora alkalitolerans TaxID=687207 RepID=A0A852U3B6_9ACTN|nr:substrate-binding domain-containing protein [Spinactinospora alkalitolerans]NYE50087.1 LacI family transcriptional regulator [Spinactinospora alkalitolerans]
MSQEDTDTGGAPPPASTPPTIHDVARRAGVSTSTVSRALDPRLPRSRSAAAARVREAARELGYTPHSVASSLRRRGTNTIGVLVPRLSDTVMAIAYEELAAACQRRGYFAIVATTHDDVEEQRSAAQSLLQRRVDGLVLTTARLNDSYLDHLRSQGVPHALALRTDGISPSSLGDDELGGYLATRHLLDLGHRRIACVAGPSYASSSTGRCEGYVRALRDQGVEPDPALIHPSAFSIEAGEEAADALLRAPDRPTAVFAINDNTAIGVLSAAHRAGLAVPDELSIVGYNDIPLVGHLPLPLTTMRVPFRDIAASAVDLLLADPDTAEERRYVHAPTLIPRASTAPPADA